MKSKESIFLIGTLFLAIATLLVLISFSHAGACDLKCELEIASQEAAQEADVATNIEQFKEFLKHQTVYASWNHLWFSWFGYLDPLPDDYFESCAFQWWGEPVFIGEN